MDKRNVNDICRYCMFWYPNADFSGNDGEKLSEKNKQVSSSYCLRFPNKILKYAIEWCGEFRRDYRHEKREARKL